MKRIMPMEIKFYGLTLQDMGNRVSEDVWSESLGDILVNSDVSNFDMRIRARLNRLDKRIQLL